MKKPKRSQTDDLTAEYSRKSADHTPGPDTARQEFAQTTDVNFILHRHGAAGIRLANVGPGVSEVNYELDLQSALGAIAAAKAAHRKMSRETREKYPTWQALFQAIENGEFTGEKKLEETVPSSEPPVSKGGTTT